MFTRRYLLQIVYCIACCFWLFDQHLVTLPSSYQSAHWCLSCLATWPKQRRKTCTNIISNTKSTLSPSKPRLTTTNTISSTPPLTQTSLLTATKSPSSTNPYTRKASTAAVLRSNPLSPESTSRSGTSKPAASTNQSTPYSAAAYATN